MTNQEILLVNRPVGLPNPDDFEIKECEVPTVDDGYILIRTVYLSVDPYMRGRMTEARSYVAPFELGKPLNGGMVGQVVESRSPDFQAGDYVAGQWAWRRYNVVKADKRVSKLNPNLAPPSTALGILGMTGLTAYLGLTKIGNPQPGETVVVSGAAGAVGSVVGQIAKLLGCRVVGIAGTKEKLAYIKDELGFDEAIDYKDRENLHKNIRAACPNGVDVYFDNVGGSISEAVIYAMNDFARIPLCGQIAHYNDTKPAQISINVFHTFVTRRIRMQGFIVSDFVESFGEAHAALAKWYQAGKIRQKETIIEGFENTPEAFIGLFHGENIGKLLVRVPDEV